MEDTAATGSPLKERASFVTLFTPAEQQALLTAARLVPFAAEATLFAETDVARYVYLLESGLLRASSSLADGHRQILAFLWPGDMFGLSENRRYVNSVEAITPAAAYRVSVDTMGEMVRADAALMSNLAIRAAHEFRMTQRHILCLGQLDIPRRIARFLLDCTAHGALYDSGTATLSLPMKRKDIADYIGASVEAVARNFTKLEHDGLIRRRSSRVLELPDPAALAHLVEHGARPRLTDVNSGTSLSD
jgi:CRP-like cAMP-binding protein